MVGIIQNCNLKFKILVALTLLTFNFAFLTFPAFAQADLPSARISPASPLYFLKSVREILEIKLAGTTYVRAIRELEFSTRRIREVKSLTSTPNEDLIEPTLERYWAHLRELKGLLNLKDENMADQVANTVTSHMDILQRTYSQVTNSSAKRSIRVAIYRLSEWEGELSDKFVLLKSPLAQRVVNSKFLGCNLLSKEASSSALNEIERAVYLGRVQKCLRPKI